MKHWEKKAKGWVFLSHSSLDYEDVKVVRNYLEDSGFSALMFYLKCLEDKDKESHIKQLISWEIEARNIFVLCESNDSKKSKWVEWETGLVKDSGSTKIFKTINMEELKYKKCTQLSKLDDLMHTASLYFLYDYDDRYKVQKIENKLNLLGFQIFKSNSNIKKGDNKREKIQSAITETSNRGIVLIFLSNNAIKSNWFWTEKDNVLNNNVIIFLFGLNVNV